MDLNIKRTTGGISLEWVNKGPLLGDLAREVQAAGVLALNRTAIESVAQVREAAAKKFIRRGEAGRRFVDMSFQVTQFATKARPEISFGVSRALLAGRSGFLIDHEAGADRVAKGRNDFPYIPVIGSSLRPTIHDTLPRWAYPKALGLLNSRGIDGGTVAGRDRTGKRKGSTRGKRAAENRKAFIIRDQAGDPVGIFRRVPLAGMRFSGTREGGKKLTLTQRRRRGSGQSTLDMLFATPKVIRITPRLDFRRTAEHVMVERIQANFEGMLAAIRDGARQDRNAAWSKADASLIRQFTRR